MLARLQQLIALSLLGVVIAAFLLGTCMGRPLLGPGALALLFVGYAGGLAVEFWLLRRSYASGDPERPRVRQLLRAWWIEVLVAPRVFLWQQPFRSTREPDHLPPNARGRRGVVLVHGFFCNRGIWNPWLRRLRAAGVPFVAVNLEPILGPIEHYSETIAAAVARIGAVTALPPVVAAHSMGGLAVRAWLRADARTQVHRVVTIASPHGGTHLARHGRRGRNVAQMRHGGDWLEALAQEDPFTARTSVVCFWSHCDNIVFPTRNATLPGADNRHLEGTPHVAMIFHPAVFDEVQHAVRRLP